MQLLAAQDPHPQEELMEVLLVSAPSPTGASDHSSSPKTQPPGRMHTDPRWPCSVHAPGLTLGTWPLPGLTHLSESGRR